MRATIALSVMLLVSIAAPALAQDKLNVGVVDFVEALKATESDGKLSDFQAQALQRKADLASIEKSLNELEVVLQEQNAVLSEEALRETVLQYRELTAQYQQLAMNMEIELSAQREEMLASIHAEMERISAEIAKENGIDLMLERNAGGVIWAGTARDYTEELIRRYNKQNP